MNKQILPISVLVLIGYLLYLNNCRSDPNLSEDKKHKQQTFQDYHTSSAENDILACIAYVEGFSSRPYYCGAWSVGYGTTRYADGSPVTPYSRSLTRDEARRCLLVHLRRAVFPAIRRNVKRPLTYGEFVSCCMFVCNVGEGNFESSSFLKALNSKSPASVCAERLALYNKVKGTTSAGLQKRRWLEGAVFCGYVSPDDIKRRRQSDIYNYGVSFFYRNGRPDFSPYVVKTFLHKGKT